MNLIAMALLLTPPIVEIDRPAPEWLSQKMQAQCGLIEGSIEFKNTKNGKRPDVLKGAVSYGSQKRSLASELDSIGKEITSVGEVGILCESRNVMLILLNANAPSGRVQYKIYVNDRLEVTVFKL